MSEQSPSGRRARRATGQGRAIAAPDRNETLRWGLEPTTALLVEPVATDDKYRRGVLGLRTGSSAYPGAAVLGAEAAWRTGLGLLRYTPPLGDARKSLGLPSPAAAVLAARPETVFMADPTGAHFPASAWVIGSGTDPSKRSEREQAALQSLLGGDAPVVVDAGALDLVLPDSLGGPPSAPVILTPHRGEFLALWRGSGLGERPARWPVRGRAGRDRVPAEGPLIDATKRLAKHLGTTVLLKGSTTVTATPGGLVTLAGPATPWLATAGTGDVLAGILGALVAAHSDAVREDPELLAALGASAAVLHDAAARRASIAQGTFARFTEEANPEPVGGPITALDIAHALPATIAELLAARRDA